MILPIQKCTIGYCITFFIEYTYLTCCVYQTCVTQYCSLNGGKVQYGFLFIQCSIIFNYVQLYTTHTRKQNYAANVEQRTYYDAVSIKICLLAAACDMLLLLTPSLAAVLRSILLPSILPNAPRKPSSRCQVNKNVIKFQTIIQISRDQK